MEIPVWLSTDEVLGRVGRGRGGYRCEALRHFERKRLPRDEIRAAYGQVSNILNLET